MRSRVRYLVFLVRVAHVWNKCLWILSLNSVICCSQILLIALKVQQIVKCLRKSNIFKIYANKIIIYCQMINLATIKSTKFYSKLRHVRYVIHKITIISDIWILGTNQYFSLLIHTNRRFWQLVDLNRFHDIFWTMIIRVYIEHNPVLFFRRLRFIITSLVMFLVIPCAYLNMDSFQIYRLLQIKENNETQLFKNASTRMQNTLKTSKLKDTRRVGKEKDETQIFKNTSARMQNTLQTSNPKDTRSVTKEKDEKQIFKNTSAKMQNTLQTSKPKYTRRVTTEKDQTQIFQNTLARMQNILKERRQARNREDSCDVETALLRNRSVKEFGTSSVDFSVSK